MIRQMLKSKIHRATVTEANVEYEGSITVDVDLLEAANILVGEKVLIVNLNNGSRVESYAMPGERGSGKVCLNGGAAMHGVPGDKVIIMTFAALTEEETRSFQQIVVKVDERNQRVALNSSPSKGIRV